MKRIFVSIALMVALTLGLKAQNASKGKIITEEKGKGFYTESILKDMKDVEEKLSEKEPYVRFVMDQSGIDLPNDPSFTKLYGAIPPNHKGMQEPAGAFQPLHSMNRKCCVSTARR